MTQQGIAQAVREEHLDLTLWAENLKKRLQRNFETQHVWPRGYPGPYIGYRNTPAAKRHLKRNPRRSINSLYADIYNGAGGDTEKIEFFFDNYLRFVDMGVGYDQKIEAVDNSSPANWRSLYKTWDGQGDRQSRPILSMEVRHQLRRLQTLVSSFYGEYIENGILMAFDDKYRLETNDLEYDIEKH